MTRGLPSRPRWATILRRRLEDALAADDSLVALARAWAASDPDPQTRQATLDLIEAGDAAALRECFGARLEFGTAGLRGALGPGPNRMNRALVRKVAAGLAAYLLEQVPQAREQGVVIAFDARRGSTDFAEDSAVIFADHGIKVFLFDRTIPTPRLAHAVVHLGACAGVMVTASHNPPSDNGYKVYWSDGAQIIPPHDHGISAAIDRLQGFDPREIGDLAAHRIGGLIRLPPDEVTRDYFQRVQALRVHQTQPLRIVYSAMHGVGGASVRRALSEAGYVDLHEVSEQAEPDGSFPTVAFPNPEEPGAMDLALALAEELEADLVLANDPDGDRVAVAVPDPDGGYRSLTGNEVGCLLAEDLLRYGPSEGGERLVATTVVSSRLLARIAAAHGARYAETLTGFKWIASAAITHDARGGRFVLGFEEALGYSAGDVARDKDGVSAILLLADLAAHAKAHGTSLLGRLGELWAAHGVHVTAQQSIKMPGLDGRERISAAMDRLRASPPRELCGHPVHSFTDVMRGEHHDLASGVVTGVDLPPSDVLCWKLGDGSRLVARPSGTEPKIKFYAEVCEVFEPSNTLASNALRAHARLGPLVDALLAAAGLP
ncbi:MAG: phospho-sugar mutase [Deltaproteobacteria bacterium]|nr:MAG: phospho-sugar mutase [Deltaproteobacteria bacterium]